MKFTFKISDKLTAELEANEQRPMFEQLAELEEIFGIKCCGKCKSTDIKFVVREDKEENKYYELQCTKCRARFAFGCNKKGNSLFPKRKDKDGKWLPNDGWEVYVPQAKE
jgi:hypothetical protein